MKRRAKLSVLPNLSRKKSTDKSAVTAKGPEDKASAAVQHPGSKSTVSRSESAIKSAAVVEYSEEKPAAVVISEPNDAPTPAFNKGNDVSMTTEEQATDETKTGHNQDVAETMPDTAKAEVSRILERSSTDDGNEVKRSQQMEETGDQPDSVLKSPIKTPVLAMRLATRTRLPKPRPNIEINERPKKRLRSISEPEDENVRQRNPSGPPPIQHVLRTSENATKSLVPADGSKEPTLIELLRDERSVDMQRKHHRSTVNEVDDIRNRKKLFYKKGNKPPEKSKMTMLDLIYWNPATNPML